jgi:hypothetical protein
MDQRAFRLARNESLYRSANEQIADKVTAVGERPETQIPFLCECPEVDCEQRIMLSLAEYERARVNPKSFLVAPGHERPEVEVVVEDRESYLIVRKVGEAGEVARDLHERS